MYNLSLFNDGFTRPSFRGLFDLHRDLDRLFDQVLGERSSEMSSLTGFAPACEIEENDSHFMVSFDVPGVAKKDIQIEVRDEKLFVSGERRRASESKGATERGYGRFQRVIALPASVDVDKIEASYEDGVLTIALPKAESSKPRQIAIQDGKGSRFTRWLKEKTEPKDAKAESSAA